jgi:hypothetical protein
MIAVEPSLFTYANGSCLGFGGRLDNGPLTALRRLSNGSPSALSNGSLQRLSPTALSRQALLARKADAAELAGRANPNGLTPMHCAMSGMVMAEEAADIIWHQVGASLYYTVLLFLFLWY